MAQGSERKIIPLDDPAIPQSATSVGTIVFRVGGLLYSHGSFEGYLVDPLSQEVVYVKGSLDGFGLQIGYISGTGDVKFEAKNPEELINETGGIFDLSVSVGEPLVSKTGFEK